MRVLTGVGLAAVYGALGLAVVYALGSVTILAAFVTAAGSEVHVLAWVTGLAGAGLGLYQGLEVLGRR
jgi:hypothetical protein